MIPHDFQEDIDALPPILRGLLDAELAAGNTIVSVSHTFPAPPAGAAVMLAGPVTTRERASGNGFVFRERNSSLYSGSFTDSRGFYYLLEPPLPPPPIPDMNAIRAAANAPRPDVALTTDSTVVDEFRASMQLDYDKWHDGIGYNLELLNNATDAEIARIMQMIVPPKGWRDVEALAAIDTEAARAALRKAIKSPKAEVRTAVTSYAPWIASPSERTETLVRALRHGELYDDLSSALDQVERHHPPAIVDELFRGLFGRPGEIACNFAGMLTFIHGKGDSAFDWNHRPLFLKFNSDDAAERRSAFTELCVLLELNEQEVLERIGRTRE